MAIRRASRVLGITAVVAVGVVALSACSSNGGASTTASGGDKKVYNIAVMQASSANGENASLLKGAKAEAAKLGDVKITAFDGGFNADTQFAQIQNVAQSGKYDGIFIEPFDGVSLAGAFPLASDIPVITWNTPIGADYNSMKPQVDGVIETIASPPGDLATQQAAYVVDHCKDIDPCKVAIMVGYLSTALDVTRMNAYKKVFASHSNIKVVASTEGQWDRDKAQTTMADVLQSNPDLNAFITPGDQMAAGASVAIQAAGIDPKQIYIASMGGAEDAIPKVRSGDWGLTGLYLPQSGAAQAIDNLVDHLKGKKIPSTVSFTDLATKSGYDFWMTTDYAKQKSDFAGEWNG